MSAHISGKSILITGAASGFGRIVAEQAAEAGAMVTCVDIDAVVGDAVAAGIRRAGGQASFIHADVTRLASLREAVEATVRTFGSIDVIVNNAGIMPLAFLSDHAAAADAWSRCIDINFKGVVNGTIAAYDKMISQGRGHIVNVSSIYGNHPVVGAAVYGATKAAVNHFSDAVRTEGQGRIKVTVIKPTGVPDTGLSRTIVDKTAAVGIFGQNLQNYMEVATALASGTADAERSDPRSPLNLNLAPTYVADAVLHVIDQPWGVNISDMTIRATGELYVL